MEKITAITETQETSSLPSFASSIAGPLVTILLLALRPLFNIVIDPLIALQAGGFAGILAMKKGRELKGSLSYGLEKMSVVAVLLIGTGTIAGIIKNSTLKEVILSGFAIFLFLQISSVNLLPVKKIMPVNKRKYTIS